MPNKNFMILGCGRSIAYEYLVNVSSLNNHPLTPMHSAPLSFPMDRSLVCARQKNVQEKVLLDRLHADCVHISSHNNHPRNLCISLFTNGKKCCLCQTQICAMERCGKLLVWILYILKVKKPAQQYYSPLYLPTCRSIICDRRKFERKRFSIKYPCVMST